jgi:acetyl-CoA carboxylase, carboxyl transferase, beta subunit
MLKKGIFKKPQNTLEGNTKLNKTHDISIPNELCVLCPSCKKTLFSGTLGEGKYVCPNCGYYFRMNARQRIASLTDTGSFVELNKDMTSKNVLSFPEYEKKLEIAELESAEKEAVITGTALIGTYRCALFVMEPYFMMGSMGTVVGEKITRLFEFATENGLPVVGVTVSGGARMQEGILSLMQMAKVSAAVKRHSDARNLYITLLTNPTMGGVTASFAMQGDIIISEPEALVGFAGPRVIEQTIRQKLPEGFQKAEFLQKTGFIDDIVERKRQKEYLTRVLLLHSKERTE